MAKESMKAMNTGVLVEGGNVTSTAGLRMAKYAQTLDIYDSLGNKHEFSIEFTKVASNQWDWRIIVPEPAEIIGAELGNDAGIIGAALLEKTM